MYERRKVERIEIDGAYILSVQDSSQVEREEARNQIRALVEQARRKFNESLRNSKA